MNPVLDSRARFEAWYAEECGAGLDVTMFRRDAEQPDEYHHWEAQAAWEAWQAAIASRASDLEDAKRWRYARDHFGMDSNQSVWITTDQGHRINVNTWARSENERAVDYAIAALAAKETT